MVEDTEMSSLLSVYSTHTRWKRTQNIIPKIHPNFEGMPLPHFYDATPFIPPQPKDRRRIFLLGADSVIEDFIRR
jgi:hypothetical protein